MYNHDFKKRFSLLKPVIIEAGKQVSLMRSSGRAVKRIKDDGSPVTTADEYANAFLRKKIEQFFPGEIIVGEEDADKTYPAGSSHVWYIDPIDGTKAYTEGGRDYYVLIGLTIEGQPVFGMHYQPETQKLIYGWEGQTPELLNFKTGETKQLSADHPNGSEPRIYLKTHNQELRDSVKSFGVKRAKYAPGMVDMIAPLFGHADGFASFRSSAYWDLVAPAAIMRAAGFRHAGDATDIHPRVLFNDGNWQTSFYYNLSPETSYNLIEHLNKVRKQFPDS